MLWKAQDNSYSTTEGKFRMYLTKHKLETREHLKDHSGIAKLAPWSSISYSAILCKLSDFWKSFTAYEKVS